MWSLFLKNPHTWRGNLKCKNLECNGLTIPAQFRCNLSMDFHDTVFNKASFNRHAYSINRPLGVWQARIDKAVYNKGSGTSPAQGGKCSGIHLYVEHERSHQKICLFIPLFPGFDPLAVAGSLNTGDCIEVEIATSKSGLPAVKTLRKLNRPIRLFPKSLSKK